MSSKKAENSKIAVFFRRFVDIYLFLSYIVTKYQVYQLFLPYSRLRPSAFETVSCSGSNHARFCPRTTYRFSAYITSNILKKNSFVNRQPKKSGKIFKIPLFGVLLNSIHYFLRVNIMPTPSNEANTPRNTRMHQLLSEIDKVLAKKQCESEESKDSKKAKKQQK